MAIGSRSYKPLHGTLGGSAVCKIFVEWTSAGAGVSPTLTTAQKARGVTSVTWTATGKFTILLSEQYVSLMGISGSAVIASATPAHVSISGNSAPTLTGSTGASIPVAIFSAATTVAPALSDLAAGDTVYVELTLNKSALNS